MSNAWIKVRRYAPYAPMGSATGSAANPSVYRDEHGYLCGDRSLVQAYATASRVNELFSAAGISVPGHAGTSEAPLTIEVAHPAAAEHGPFYQRVPVNAIYTNNNVTACDPDVIAHEQGHAILDHHCHYQLADSFTASAHEAFADVTALITALQSEAVRQQVAEAWERGELSTVASVIGEGASDLAYHPSSGSTERAGQTGTARWNRDALRGLRDLAQPVPAVPETDAETPHEASARFSHGVYRALHQLYTAQRRAYPWREPTAVLREVSERVSGDFVHSLEFLPLKPTLCQSDLGLALIEANRNYHGGLEENVYRESMKPWLQG